MTRTTSTSRGSGDADTKLAGGGWLATSLRDQAGRSLYSPGLSPASSPLLNVRSYALDAIETSAGKPLAPSAAEVQRFLESIKAAAAERFDALGEGEDIRITGEGISGGALAAGGRVVHLAGFALAPPEGGREPRRSRGERGVASGLFEQLGMGAGANKDYFFAFLALHNPVDEDPVSANMAVPVVGPFAFQGMIDIFGR